jgi:hypothetical protein
MKSRHAVSPAGQGSRDFIPAYMLGMLGRPGGKHAHANSGVGMPPGNQEYPVSDAIPLPQCQAAKVSVASGGRRVQE